MVQPNDLRFTLVIGGIDYVLPHSPSGWEESLLNWKKSSLYWGLIRSFSVPMKFVLDGAWLLRREYYGKGVEGLATFKADRLNRSTWGYENIYTGEIDFSTCIDSENFFEVNVMEGGISAMVKAYEGVKYEFPMDVPEAITVRLPGIPDIEQAAFVVNPDVFNNEPIPGTPFRMISAIPGMSVTMNEFPADITIQPVAVVSSGVVPNDFLTGDDWFIRSTGATTVRIYGVIGGSFSRTLSIGTFYLRVVSSRSPAVQVAYTILETNQIAGDYERTFDFEYTFQAGEKLFIAASEQVQGSAGFESSISVAGDLNVSRAAVTPDTLCKAFRCDYLFQQLINKMNRPIPPATQSFLLQSYRQLVITCGDAVRQIEGAKLKTSFKDFFQSIDALLSAGFGVENNKAVLEEKAYWMKPTLKIVTLTDIKDFSLEPAIEYMFSSIKAGYPDNDYEREEGRDEFNSEQQYSTPITRVQQEFDARSIYRADQFGIEEARIITETENDTNTDAKTDNDVFFLWINAVPAGGIYDVFLASDYDEVSGIQPGTRYNLEISPKHNLLRHASYIRSAMDKLDSRAILFESAEKNAELSVTNFGNTIKENENIQIAQLGEKMFLPYIATITTRLPRNVQQMITDLPTGFIQFKYRGDFYRGFILEASSDVARNSPQTFKLLLTADNNMDRLIR